MEESKAWEKFRDTGLLWWINKVLYPHGWMIRLEGGVQNAYPVRIDKNVL